MSYAYDLQSLLYKVPVQLHSADAGTGSYRLSYEDLLDKVRTAMTRQYPELIREAISSKEAQQKMRMLITKHVHEQRFAVADQGMEKLQTVIDKLHDDMFGFGILTPYLYDEKVQEINVNRWDDIEIIYPDGYRKLTEKFTSPQQAQDVAKKMARLGGVTVDGSTPDGDSQITEGVRVHVKVPPIIDDKAGVHISIRKQRREAFSRAEFIKRGTATAEELDLLSLALSHGVSIGIAGSAGSGKTTDVNYLLNTVPPHLRIYIIEEAREIQLERQDENGIYISRVMHTKTRHHTNASFHIDARKLVRDALWCDPNIIVPAEMRGAEALDVMEAGRTGHTIISTFHAQGSEDAYRRIASMAMMAGAGYSEDTLLKFAYASFPLMVHKMKLPDGTLKYVEISEAQHLPNDEYKVVPLYSFIPSDTSSDGHIIGDHKQLSYLSDALVHRLRLGGASAEQLKPFIK